MAGSSIPVADSLHCSKSWGTAGADGTHGCCGNSTGPTKNWRLLLKDGRFLLRLVFVFVLVDSIVVVVDIVVVFGLFDWRLVESKK